MLRAVTERDSDATLSEIAAIVDLPRPTVHRLLELLAAECLVEQDPVTRLWRPGTDLSRLGALAMSRRDVVAEARPVMRRLVETSRETCLLGIYVAAKQQMTFAAETPSPEPLSYRIELNTLLPVVWGASGLAILAYLPDDEIDAILANQAVASPVSGAELDTDRVRRDIKRIRVRGYAATRAQKIAGSRGIASPVLDARGQALGSICLTIPEMRYRAARAADLSAAVIRAGAEISRSQGWRG